MRGLGTLLNVAAIAAGASAGTLLGDRLPGRLRDAVKSLLDGFAMLAFASYLGWGVAASGLAVLAYQGGLAAGLVAAIR
jgi:uncharacterized membrane protein YqgA involved in biofilm formation